MHAVVLSAAPAGHESMGALAKELAAELERAGFATMTTFDLTATKLAFCQGDFDCWVKTPGHCRSKDAEADIVRAVHDADALVLLGPVSFGGHNHVLKRAVDRFICLVEPFFTKRRSLTHHSPRYDHPASLFSVGWTAEPAPDVAATYAELNDGNAVNFLAPGCGAVVLDDAHREGWGASLRAMLASPKTPGDTITGREPLRAALLSAARPDADARVPGPPARVAILIGSPKPKGTSASEALARALELRFGRARVHVEIHFATQFVHDDWRAAKAADTMAACDLLLLVTPLYVDSFPGPTTHALELVAAARARASTPARFALLVNCGFPEAEQNRTAVRIARHFADQASYAWGGALPLGGGGVVTGGSPLDESKGAVRHVVRALDLATAALVNGDAVPPEALEEIVKAPIPDAVYRMIGDLGWRWQVHRHGLPQSELHARPLDHEAPDAPERPASPGPGSG